MIHVKTNQNPPLKTEFETKNHENPCDLFAADLERRLIEFYLPVIMEMLCRVCDAVHSK